MGRPYWILLGIAAIILGIPALTASVAAAPLPLAPTPGPTPGSHVATPAELEKARAEWAASGHAETYDQGQGANTTCARCKSPLNWDPGAPAADAALDCAACKRLPGAARPDLPDGVPVAADEWKQIGCEICHQPVGDSYSTALAFWDQASGRYEPVSQESELCAKCHEGSHGFEVIEEQSISPAHQGWACSRCHGAHGVPATCESCHDPTEGNGAAEHARHTGVNCTACHDAGGLSIWQDADPNARHFGEVITVRFAHALRSWPSHNLQTPVDCRRCHHPANDSQPAAAANVSCKACHPDGASLYWCTFFPRDASPDSARSPMPFGS